MEESKSSKKRREFFTPLCLKFQNSALLNIVMTRSKHKRVVFLRCALLVDIFMFLSFWPGQKEQSYVSLFTKRLKSIMTKAILWPGQNRKTSAAIFFKGNTSLSDRVTMKPPFDVFRGGYYIWFWVILLCWGGRRFENGLKFDRGGI